MGGVGIERKERSKVYDRTDVINACQRTASSYGFDPIQLYALARQESAKTKDGHFDASIPRLEQGFFENYVKGNHQLPTGLPTTALVLLSSSYGCWQIMGYELWRLKWLDERFNRVDNPSWKDTLQSPYSQLSLVQAFDEFCMDLNAQCKYACILLKEKQNTANKKDSFKGMADKEEMAYLLWNGGGDPDYGKKILKWKELGLE
jgi:hypothetical protein